MASRGRRLGVVVVGSLAVVAAGVAAVFLLPSQRALSVSDSITEYLARFWDDHTCLIPRSDMLLGNYSDTEAARAFCEQAGDSCVLMGFEWDRDLELALLEDGYLTSSRAFGRNTAVIFDSSKIVHRDTNELCGNFGEYWVPSILILSETAPDTYYVQYTYELAGTAIRPIYSEHRRDNMDGGWYIYVRRQADGTFRAID